MPPDLPFFPNDHCLSEPLPSATRPYRDCCTVANARTVMEMAREQEEADARSSRSPPNSAADGMDLLQLKVQTSSLPPRHATQISDL